jgi:hypothetical protein
MASYPKDQFDVVPDDLRRVGAHRGPVRKGRGWIIFAWALLATGVLVFGGLFGLSKYLGIDLGLPFLAADATPTPTPTPTPTAKPLTDPSKLDPARGIKITVLNGTAVVGLQDGVAASLTARGWPVDTATQASQKDVQETTVYYAAVANEDVARGVVLAIGKGRIRLVSADTFPSAPITVVLGRDFPVPTPAAG